MSTTGKRARDKDRDAAIEVVEAAWADGQIVEADRDRRVQELLSAQTIAEIEMLIHDLQLPAGIYPTPPQAPAAGGAPKAKVPTSLPLVALLVVVAVLGVAVAGVVAAVVAVTGSPEPETVGASDPVPISTVDLFSPGGYGDLVADVASERGSTEVFEAVLYPGYAVLYLPADATSSRYELWYWDGRLDDLDSRNTLTGGERLDLADVDPAVVVRLIRKVKRLVDEPVSWYAIVRAPDPANGAAITTYASNEYSESEYASATLEGRIVFDSTRP